MSTKVKAARRKGLLRGVVHRLRVAGVFALTALLSYCGVGNLAAPPPQMITVSTAP